VSPATPSARDRSESDGPVGFWSDNQPGFRFTDSEPGTPEFFAAVESHRYSLEPAIRELAGFDRWRDRDVLRISVSNWSTDEDDVAASVAAVRRAAER